MFYIIAHQLLDQFYPEHTVTVTNRDPPYITGHIKAMLRRKNRLMRKGRVEEASALAQRIGKEITRRTKTQLSTIQHVDSRAIWECVRRLRGKKQQNNRVSGIDGESRNDYYCKISTDHCYTAPPLKQTATNLETDYIAEWRVF